jgi:hypothetical protein
MSDISSREKCFSLLAGCRHEDTRSIGMKRNFQLKCFFNFRSRRWGSSLTICARLTVRSFPHQHERIFSGAHVCWVTFIHLPQPLVWNPHIFVSEPYINFSKYPPFPPNAKCGCRGGPRIFVGVGILIFVLLRSPCKIAKPYNSPFWENYQWAGRDSGHLHLGLQPKVSTRTPLGPIIKLHILEDKLYFKCNKDQKTK